jgi:hypothetical protein
MTDGQRAVGAVAQGVGDVTVVGVDCHPKVFPAQAETQPVDGLGELRVEREDALVVAQAAEAGDQRRPRPSQ